MQSRALLRCALPQHEPWRCHAREQRRQSQSTQRPRFQCRTGRRQRCQAARPSHRHLSPPPRSGQSQRRRCTWIKQKQSKASKQASERVRLCCHCLSLCRTQHTRCRIITCTASSPHQLWLQQHHLHQRRQRQRHPRWSHPMQRRKQ